MIVRRPFAACVWIAFFALGVSVGAQENDASAGKSVSARPLSSLELAQWLDERFAALWKADRVTPAPVVDDATFLRRVYLDLLGTIPSVAQARDFLEDENTFKREDLVDRLLADDRPPDRHARRSAEHLARVWRRIIAPPGSPNATFAAQLEPWLEEQFAENTRYDEMTRRLITAGSGRPPTADAGGEPVVFYQVVGGTPDNVADSVSRVFLGVRLGCAKCHDHPFAQWTQEDFWGMAAFFAGRSQDGTMPDAKVATIRPEESDQEYAAKFLWAEEENGAIPDDQLPRQTFAEWLTSEKNPNFAATAVNRVWRHLTGRSLVGTVDELDRVSPEERAILDELAARFIASGYDLHWLIAGVCKSKVYQRAAAVSGDEQQEQLAAHRPLKTLAPEQVFDALEQALLLPVTRNDGSPRYNGQRDQLVARLDEAMSDSPSDFRSGVPQALMLMNGKLTADATDLETSRTLRAVVDAPFLPPEQKIEALYLAAFTRLPRPEEREFMLHHIDSQPDQAARRRAYGEIFWGLLNSPEFVLSR